ncbi:MAG: gluconate 2-dehydrogenase subunit 3 family protein [Chloroflexi bacterium]|nr:gluconate 2-dehydrogenase subunit 3 family protein [Chloroflexota bacterium]
MSKQHVDGEILTKEQLALLAAIQNRLIPAQDEMPGAGDAGCASMLDRFLSERAALRRPILAALNAIEAAAGERRQASAVDDAASTYVAFLALSNAERDEVLRAVELAHEDLFSTLLNQTYTAYYTNPAVLLVLGWNPPQPEGFPTPPPFDEALLANVKQRGKIWRDA